VTSLRNIIDSSTRWFSGAVYAVTHCDLDECRQWEWMGVVYSCRCKELKVGGSTEQSLGMFVESGPGYSWVHVIDGIEYSLL
jgi:hypothetical protein